MMRHNYWRVMLLCTASIFLWECSNSYTPKPKDYPHINLPAHEYAVYQSPSCPFTIEMSVHATIQRDEKDSLYKPEDDCWFNIHYPELAATIYLSYKSLGGDYTLAKLKNDAHRLTFKHTEKADFIQPAFLETPFNVFGLVYNVGGDAASATQFYATDTMHHWLRGALYFKTTPNADSLAPVIKYINQDIKHMIESLRWTEA